MKRIALLAVLVLVLTVFSTGSMAAPQQQDEGVESVVCGDNIACTQASWAVRISNNGGGGVLLAEQGGFVVGIKGRGRPGVLGVSGAGIGVMGKSTNGYGVFGSSMNDHGVFGRSENLDGVRGYSTGGGIADNGVYGETNSTSSGEAGVYGLSTAAAAGVRGHNTANSTGVFGSTGGGVGVHGTSASGLGVYGFATDPTGTNYGVYGYTASQDGFGVYGYESGGRAWDNAWWEPAAFFSGRNGVVAYSNINGYGVIGEHTAGTGDGAGIYGSTDSISGWAGRFETSIGHGVGISTPFGKIGLTVSGGTKNAVVGTGDGGRLLYSEEATEVWFADYGFGQLQDGLAVIAIDPVFAQTVNLEVPYHVFVQVYGDAEIYVSNRTPIGFEVHLRDGDPKVEFSYRLVAQRLGYEGVRLERAPWADNDPNLFQGVEAESTGGRAEGEPVERDHSPPVLEPEPEQ